MKNTSNFIAFYKAIIICLSFNSSMGFAQNVYSPSNYDNSITSSTGIINCTSIDYSPFYSGGLITNPQLTAVIQDNGTNQDLYVWDQLNPSWVHVSVSGYLSSGGGDIIIGNDITGTYDYIIAIVIGDCLYSKNVYLYEYGVTGEGTGSLAVTYISNTPIISGSSTQGAGWSPHIDGIAEYHTNFLGMPRCNKFVITWQNYITGDIDGYFATLNSPASGSPIAIVTGLPSPHVYGGSAMPDVAAVERYNSAISSYNDIGIFCYIDHSGMYPILKKAEYDFSIGFGSNTSLFTSIDYSWGIGIPRIDAIDDFNNNSPTGLNAYFDVVTMHSTSINSWDVWQFNNLNIGIGENICDASAIYNPYSFSSLLDRNHIPVVACGIGGNYSLAFYNDNTYNTYLAEAFDWTYGSVMTTSPNAYIIPYSSIASPWAGYGSLAIAGTSNTNTLSTQSLFTCWTNGSHLDFKFTTSIYPFGFKHNPTALQGVISTSREYIYPNPVKDLCNLIVSDFSRDKNIQYSISDIYGKVLFEGKILSENQEFNFSDLIPGIYFMNINREGQSKESLKIVKQ